MFKWGQNIIIYVLAFGRQLDGAKSVLALVWQHHCNGWHGEECESNDVLFPLYDITLLEEPGSIAPHCAFRLPFIFLTHFNLFTDVTALVMQYFASVSLGLALPFQPSWSYRPCFFRKHKSSAGLKILMYTGKVHTHSPLQGIIFNEVCG